MEFLKICEYVNNKLKEMSLIEKILLFREIFKSPINYKDGVFYYSGKESTESRVSDYLAIRAHWMNMQEFDKLELYFKNKDDVNK